MSQDEIMELDLHTIYKLIDIHANVNNPNPNKKEKKVEQQEDVFIDNIKF